MASPEELVERADQALSRWSGARGTVAACGPGRVELLGNHTDYNGGLVASTAIDRWTAVVGRSRDGHECRVFALNMDQGDTFDAREIEPTEPGAWSRYVRGVCWTLAETFGPLQRGFDAAIVGDVPLGAGLSSSASLQAAMGMFLIGAGVVRTEGALEGLGESDCATEERARMALAHALRLSENAFVGVGSGLLDQFSSLFGMRDSALWLDCQTLEHGSMSLGSPAPATVVCDSGTSRRLADGMYEQRVRECGTVVEHFRRRRGTADSRKLSLRQVSLEELETEWDRLDPVGRRRARHVLTENERVRKGIDALRRGDVEEFGRLMSASHRSSQSDFENSSPALDALIAAAEEAPGFLGGKLSGAGWAGCTVNLVRSDRAHEFAESVRAGYRARTGATAVVYVCRAAEGARFTPRRPWFEREP
jgi:galactokinase